MIILGIETSCDETALSIIESENGTDIAVLADKTLSQIELHRQYGGVFPNAAKREHSRNLVPLLKTVLEEASKQDSRFRIQDSGKKEGGGPLSTFNFQLSTLLEREPEMLEQFLAFIPTIERPPIDAIAVTEGPGLEPCLWTGINLARALSLVWGIPLVPVNHMEGHIFSALIRRKDVQNAKRKSQNDGEDSQLMGATRYTLHATHLPSLALLISGGHTELVLIKGNSEYEIVGQTRDDAVGEAFDKVARLLGLPYPGGPEISRLAEQRRELQVESSKLKVNAPSTDNLQLTTYNLPRPMLHSPDFDFSFSGIKTSVLYLIKKLPALTEDIKKELAFEFETAVTEVLIAKTRKAMEHFGASTLLLGGGVIANKHIRSEFEKLSNTEGFTLHIPEKSLTTDNALMIAVVGLIRHNTETSETPRELRANGNLHLN